MNCLEARKYIYDFVQKNWEEEMVEDFLKHLHSCQECQEELRITHMVYHGLRSLDDKEELRIDGSYAELQEEAGRFLFHCHFFSAFRIVSETLVFWAVTFSLICFIAKYGVYLT